MKITVSQKEKKLEITFKENKIVEKYRIAKAEDFLACVDRVVKLWQRRQRRHLQSRAVKLGLAPQIVICPSSTARQSKSKFYYPVDRFLKKRHNSKTCWKSAVLEFQNTGLLTERIIRSIILGLSF
ncbi:MAG: hypothetical protein NT078_00665 [Candidatus Azambacteria bacterium]|nr:hypothetical protein [Candidatus Azambacteria bacterium]